PPSPGSMPRASPARAGSPPRPAGDQGRPGRRRAPSEPAREWAWPRERLLRDDAILDLDPRARGHRLNVRDRKPLAHLGAARRAPPLAELTEYLARHRMHERDRVTPEADEGPRPDAVDGGQVDDDARLVHVDDESPLGALRSLSVRGRGRGRGRASWRRGIGRSRRRLIGRRPPRGGPPRPR